MLYAAGDLERAQATLAQGLQVAAADPGLSSVQARIRVLLAEIQVLQDAGIAEALEACDAAAALLESDDDLEGLAEVWLSAGKAALLRLVTPRLPNRRSSAPPPTPGKAATTARSRSPEPGWWRPSWSLPIPADVAIGRAERLLEAASGDPWDEAAILRPLSLLYGYAGRFADARAAYQPQPSPNSPGRGETRLGAVCRDGRPDRADRRGLRSRPSRSCGRGMRPSARWANAGTGQTSSRCSPRPLYAQGRFGEALRLTEEGEALAGAGDFDAQGRWRATRAKLLARRGQFRAAARLAEEAVALVPATSDAPERAEFLVAQAEVSRLAGAPGQAEASLRRALQFYQDRRMVPLAERTRALLASLTRQTAPH